MRDHPLASLVCCNKPKYFKSSGAFRVGSINHGEEIRETFKRNIAKEKLALIKKLIRHYQFSPISFQQTARKLRIKQLTACVPLYSLLYNKPHLLVKCTEDML